jgi:ATP adenylyltransferase
MDQLWAPWRLDYVTQPKTSKTPTDANPPAPACFVCRAISESVDSENYIVERGSTCFTILNRFPYNNGHLLICPKSHKADLADLTLEESRECQETLVRMMGFLTKHLKAEGFNVGLNLGKVAGAGLPGHLHWHIVPRWAGDTNFMPVLANSRVIVQSLDALWNLLSQECKTV